MTNHLKTIEQTYQMLDEIDHVRSRLAIYAGSPKLQDFTAYVFLDDKFTKRNLKIIPAFVKVYSELLDNAVDEYRRAPDVMKNIKVSIDRLTGEISVQDDGRGIPVQIHSEVQQYVPEMVFTNLRAGSNFGDVSGDTSDHVLIGVNGLGSKLTCICSEYFIIETADGKKSFKMECRNGMREKSDPIIHGSSRHFTKITFMPDYNFFGMDGIDDDHYLLLAKRVIDCAATTPNVNFYLNDKLIKVDTFEDYVKMYQDDFVYEQSENWKIAVAESTEGFESISFVNGVETFLGGTHVEYIANQVVTKVRDHIMKKHKVDVKPSDIKTHLRVFIDCVINRPSFSSQNKEMLSSPVSEWKTSHTISDKFVKKLVGSSVIQSILEWVYAKQAAQEAAEDRKRNKSVDSKSLKKIAKFHDATTKNRAEAVLYLAEGDSAATCLTGTRNPATMGIFPLKGRPINVCASTMAKVKANAEFENIRQILGLKYGVPAKIEELNFGRIVISSDADSYGAAIAGLLINLFYRMWPEIIEAGIVYRLVTPVVSVKGKGIDKEFFSMEAFEQWCSENRDKKFTYKFLKGLGSNDSKMFKKYLDNPDKYQVQFTLEGDKDKELLDLCFLKDKGFTDMRKEWLAIEADEVA